MAVCYVSPEFYVCVPSCPSFCSGTPYDQTKGLAAGPYGNPNRYDRNTEVQPEVANGYFERTISIHRTSYSFVAQARAPKVDHLAGPAGTTSVDYPNGLGGVLWLAHHSPQNSLYLPLYAATLRLPDSFGRGSLYRMDRASAWWAFCAVANNADRMYGPIHAFIAERQAQIEKDSVQLVERISHKAAQLVDKNQPDKALELISNFTVTHNQQVIQTPLRSRHGDVGVSSWGGL